MLIQGASASEVGEEDMRETNGTQSMPRIVALEPPVRLCGENESVLPKTDGKNINILPLQELLKHYHVIAGIPSVSHDSFWGGQIRAPVAEDVEMDLL